MSDEQKPPGDRRFVSESRFRWLVREWFANPLNRDSARSASHVAMSALSKAARQFEEPARASTSGRRPRHIADVVELFDGAMELAGIEVTVHELDQAGNRAGVASLHRLVRCLRANGLLDESDSITVSALRALAAGEPVEEVAEDYGVTEALVKEVAPLLGLAAG